MSDRLRSFVLWIGAPLCVALAATGLQVFCPGIYWRERPASVVGCLTSDVFDLCVVLPTLLVTTILARRGSSAALLLWTGTLGFLTYNFLIYAFDVHFNAMFLVYCAVLGLSFYGLVGVRQFLDPAEIGRTHGAGAPRRPLALTFLLIAAGTANAELREIATAIRAGQVPAAAVDAGQLTNPIHVLDLCFLVPALVATAVLLLRRKDVGLMLAPALCTALILIGLQVAAMIAVLVRKGFGNDYTPAIFFGTTTIVLIVLLVRHLTRRALPSGDPLLALQS